MTRFFVSRLLQAVLVLLATSVVVFIALYVAADPVRTMLPIGTPQAVINQTRHALGLDSSLIEQYWRFLRGAVELHFGDSLWLGTDALSATLARVPATISIVVPATCIGTVAGCAMGLFAAFRRGTVIDSIVETLNYIAMSVAEFWVALVAILVLAVHFGWFSAGGYGLDVSHALLPILVLSIRPFAFATNLMRATAVEELKKPYVLTAVAMGASKLQVAVRHVLGNTLIPVTTAVLYNLSKMFIGTTAAVEVVFGWPGMGPLIVGALQNGDIYLVQAIVIVSACTIVLLNLIADVATIWLDPRSRHLAMGRGARGA